MTVYSKGFDLPDPSAEDLAWAAKMLPELEKLMAIECKEIIERARRMRPVITSCPHNGTLYLAGEDWHCSWCGQIVHPDPEGLRHGFIEYGRKRASE